MLGGCSYYSLRVVLLKPLHVIFGRWQYYVQIWCEQKKIVIDFIVICLLDFVLAAVSVTYLVSTIKIKHCFSTVRFSTLTIFPLRRYLYRYDRKESLMKLISYAKILHALSMTVSCQLKLQPSKSFSKFYSTQINLLQVFFTA